MIRGVALLRAVNVGGHAPVRMTDLSEFFRDEGYSAVQTLLQSGNVVFGPLAGSGIEVETRLEKHALRDLGLATEFFVRSDREWAELLRQNPFPEEAESDPGHLVVAVCKTAPAPSAWQALDSDRTGPERVAGIGRHAYIVYPDGMGRSELSSTRLERGLGVRVTCRNWNTTRRIAQLLEEGEIGSGRE